jgi:hypothetical protein
MRTRNRRRNPDWTEAELIVALDAYFSLKESRAISWEVDPKTVRASQILNSLELHPHEKRTPMFRDPAGVRRRFNYFQRLQNGEKIVGRAAYVSVWERYHNDRDGLRRDAIEIAAGIFVPADELKLSEHEKLEEDLQLIRTDPKLKETEKVALIKARQGQGRYRSELIKIWRNCAITNCREQSLLIASHLKPWSKSTNSERLDPFNGLLLSPTWDRLFDKGLASVNDDGRILVSSYLASKDRNALGIPVEGRISIEKRHLPYVRHHRKIEFKT